MPELLESERIGLRGASVGKAIACDQLLGEAAASALGHDGDRRAHLRAWCEPGLWRAIAVPAVVASTRVSTSRGARRNIPALLAARRYGFLMPPLSTLPAFVAASLLLLVIPGPAVRFVVARSGAQGRRAGLISVLGVHTASIVHVLAAVVGLSAILVASSIGFSVVKVAGGAYLVYLGVKSLRSARRADISPEPAARPARRLFSEGFVVNLFNPKVALFFLAFLPQFVERDHGAIWSQTLALGMVYIALGLVSDGAYAVVGARAGGWLRQRRGALRASRYAEGGLLIGLGVLAVALPHRLRKNAAWSTGGTTGGVR